jgi:hypothetical protein
MQAGQRKLIISPDTPGWDPETVGKNINGPSLIRVPDWVEAPLGRYYLYFAHHQGKSIRLAYADQPEGPWTIHTPGTLQLEQTPFQHHIASPDLHIDEQNQQLIMYYHGCWALDPEVPWEQSATRAVSRDGINWQSDSVELGESYFRVFTWEGMFYAVAKSGLLYRSAEGVTPFEIRHGALGFGPPGPGRHWAVLREGSTLHVWFSRFFDTPEHIIYGTVDLEKHWSKWRVKNEQSALKPREPWEGADQPIEPSRAGAIHRPVNQLRDPAIFRDGDPADPEAPLYLIYSVAGEAGLGITRIELPAREGS